MLSTAGYLLASALLAQAPSEPISVERSGPPIAAAAAIPVQAQTGEPGASTSPGERRHRFALGGTTALGVSGGSGSVRFFVTERLGVNAAIGYYRAVGLGPSRGNAFIGAPSFVYMLTPINLDAEIDLRPYVGGGFNYTRTRAGDMLGHQELAGVELTFKSVNDMTISAEVAHHDLRVQGASIPGLQGTNFNLMFHFYLR